MSKTVAVMVTKGNAEKVEKRIPVFSAVGASVPRQQTDRATLRVTVNLNRRAEYAERVKSKAALIMEDIGAYLLKEFDETEASQVLHQSAMDAAFQNSTLEICVPNNLDELQPEDEDSLGMDSALGDGESISSVHTAHTTATGATGVSGTSGKTTASTRKHLKETSTRLAKTLAEKAEQSEALEKERAANAEKDKEIEDAKARVKEQEAQLMQMQRLLAEKFQVDLTTMDTRTGTMEAPTQHPIFKPSRAATSRSAAAAKQDIPPAPDEKTNTKDE